MNNSDRTVSKLSIRFKNCPDSFKTVRTVSKLSGQFQNCPDGFRTVRMVSKLSGRFQNCPDGFKTVRAVSNIELREALTFIFGMSRAVFTRFFDMTWDVYARASSGKFLRVKSCYPENFRFLGLCGNIGDFYNMRNYFEKVKRVDAEQKAKAIGCKDLQRCKYL